MKKSGNDIVISPLAYAKIQNWVDLCSQEISGFGYVDVLDDGTIYVDDVFILEQEVSGSDTEIGSDALAKFLSTCPLEDYDRIRFWWHSHVNMSVFWSGTDEAGIDLLRGDGFFLHGVFNKKGDAKIRLEVAEKYWNHTFDNLDFKVKDLTGQHDSLVRKEIEKFVESDSFDHEDIVSSIQSFLNNMPSTEEILRQSTRDHCKSEMNEKVTSKVYARSLMYGGGIYYGGKHASHFGGKRKKTWKKQKRVIPMLPDNNQDDDVAFADLEALLEQYQNGEIEYE